MGKTFRHWHDKASGHKQKSWNAPQFPNKEYYDAMDGGNERGVRTRTRHF